MAITITWAAQFFKLMSKIDKSLELYSCLSRGAGGKRQSAYPFVIRVLTVFSRKSSG